jgi:hypothetical protein
MTGTSGSAPPTPLPGLTVSPKLVMGVGPRAQGIPCTCFDRLWIAVETNQCSQPSATLPYRPSRLEELPSAGLGSLSEARMCSRSDPGVARASPCSLLRARLTPKRLYSLYLWSRAQALIGPCQQPCLASSMSIKPQTCKICRLWQFHCGCGLKL